MQLKQIDWSVDAESARRHACAATVEWFSYSQETPRLGMRCWVIARIGDWPLDWRCSIGLYGAVE